MRNLCAMIVIETPPIQCSNAGKRFLTINLHLITAVKSLVFSNT